MFHVTQSCWRFLILLKGWGKLSHLRWCTGPGTQYSTSCPPESGGLSTPRPPWSGVLPPYRETWQGLVRLEVRIAGKSKVQIMCKYFQKCQQLRNSRLKTSWRKCLVWHTCLKILQVRRSQRKTEYSNFGSSVNWDLSKPVTVRAFPVKLRLSRLFPFRLSSCTGCCHDTTVVMSRLLPYLSCCHVVMSGLFFMSNWLLVAAWKI